MLTIYISIIQWHVINVNKTIDIYYIDIENYTIGRMNLLISCVVK
jgi:hypothetical protein